eukprot:CAMPEP_0176287254 /NCGR_PEP_ID=MMETSP0121_2-20121125/53337_1 /TAXON_ID=160619 /ORGANISM="Kryptoperidinium foliaceum, Strain CCMP 1326" /LENGTH=284 /DNA_ID=CAMNT_0017627857 /DNA_START=155 /DNA_END=1009 /DNA_ORIENTATION=+
MKGSIYLEPHDRQMRGWTMLMSQGAMNSFLYPLLLGNPAFGEKALACAVLWDLGGNMWICQFALFAIAAFYKPTALGDDRVGKELVSNEGADDEEGESLIAKPAVAKGGGASAALRTLSDSMPREILMDALKQPVLICCVMGFLMSFFGVPLPTALDTPLWVAGEPYKIALYFLVGFYGEFSLSSEDVTHLKCALGLRYLISGIIMVVVMAFLPFEPIYRNTVALALLSPTSSYTIFLVGEHGYGEAMLRLTVCGGFVSTLMSTIMQNVAIEVFASGVNIASSS